LAQAWIKWQADIRERERERERERMREREDERERERESVCVWKEGKGMREMLR
jgi:hypothetical protein